MRFAVVSGFFPPRPGGRARRVASLVRRYAAAGHEVLVLTAHYPGAPAEECLGDYRVVRLPTLSTPIAADIGFTALSVAGRRRIFRTLHEFVPDALHLHGQFFDLAVAAGSYARRYGVPLLVTIHSRAPSQSLLGAAAFRLLDKVLVRSVFDRTAPRYVVADKAGRDFCLRHYRADERDINCFPLPLDTPRFALAPGRNLRAELALGDGPLIVSLAHVTARRNLLPLVEALPAILAAYPRARVLVVGKIYHDAFAQRAEELGVRRAVSVQGVVPRWDVPAYFAAADVVAHDLNGGCGTASLEAMLAGVPTITSVAADNYPGVELRNGVNALLVPPDDPAAVAATVIGLLDNPGRAERIAWQQNELVRRVFSIEAVAANHLRLLEKLVADKVFRQAFAGSALVNPDV